MVNFGVWRGSLLAEVVAWLWWCWRVVATALAYSLFGIGGVLLPIILAPFLYLTVRDPLQRQVRARWVVSFLFKAFIKCVRLLGILRWTVVRPELLSRPGLLVIANHPTLLDVVFLIAFIPNATCIVKSVLRNNPAMRGFVRMTGYIANDKGVSMIAAASDAMSAGSTLIVFPEGTRSVDGRPIQLQRGAANIAVRSGVNITPVIINCLPPTLSKEHKWYYVPRRTFEMTFSVGDDIRVDDYCADFPSRSSRELTEYLENYFTERRANYGK